METKEQIGIDEGGYQSEIYLCDAGKRTWLWGRNIKDRPITAEEWESLEGILTAGGTMREWGDKLFAAEIASLHMGLSDMGMLPEHEEARIIVINMAYNMGLTRFNARKWPNFFKAIYDEDYEEAALQMKYTDSTKTTQSKWYRESKRYSNDLNRSRAIRLHQSMKRIALEVAEAKAIEIFNEEDNMVQSGLTAVGEKPLRSMAEDWSMPE